MPTKPGPSISAVVAAYQAEDWIAEALESILGQTRPPDEVVVVDDGSTDGTAREIERFAEQDSHRPAAQRRLSGGVQHRLQSGPRRLRGDVRGRRHLGGRTSSSGRSRRSPNAPGDRHRVQRRAGVRRRPRAAGECLPTRTPSVGIMDRRKLGRTMYRSNPCAPPRHWSGGTSTSELGPFGVELATEDYDYWLRAVRAGAVFYYDPAMLVRYRRHAQRSRATCGDERSRPAVHGWHAALVDSRALVREVQARDLSRSPGCSAIRAVARGARRRSCPRCVTGRRCARWRGCSLSAPDRYRRPLADRVVSIKRTVSPRLGMNVAAAP